MSVSFAKPITDQEIITHKLESDGWSLTHHCINRGGYNKPSDWSVTIQRNNQSFTTEYHKGAAHRRWKRRLLFWTGTYTWSDYIQVGRRVQQILPRLKDPTKCKPEQQERQQLAIDEFAQLSEPESPTLDEVVYSLYMDANGVRFGQTFEDWCGEYGMDTDSRKALASYDACRNEWSALIRLGADFDALEKLFQDY